MNTLWERHTNIQKVNAAQKLAHLKLLRGLCVVTFRVQDLTVTVPLTVP